MSQTTALILRSSFVLWASAWMWRGPIPFTVIRSNQGDGRGEEMAEGESEPLPASRRRK